MSNQKKYILHAKKLFLTYPACFLTPEEAIFYLGRRMTDLGIRIVGFVVGRENHKDGTPHLHCVLILNKQLYTRRPRFADIANYHGHYKAAKARDIDYCKKEGDFITEGLYYDWGDFLNASTSTEYLEAVKLNQPFHYQNNYDKLFRFSQNHFIKTDSIKYTLSDFNWAPIPQEQLTQFAWIIYGSSDCGKTSFAMAHFKKPLLVTQIEDLKKLVSGDYDGLVFDDMDFCHTNFTNVISLIDLERTRSVYSRYYNAEIPARFPRIFTHNKDYPLEIFFVPRLYKSNFHGIFRRCKWMHVDIPLFQRAPEDDPETGPIGAAYDNYLKTQMPKSSTSGGGSAMKDPPQDV